jgi:adenylate cyclase
MHSVMAVEAGGCQLDAAGSAVARDAYGLAATFALSLRNMTITQFGVAVLLLGPRAVRVGFFLILVAGWLTATAIRVVRPALERAEGGDLNCEVQVFDGTELGELQRGFNAMVGGLRQREHVRDLFGRHVGRTSPPRPKRKKSN